MGFDTKWCVLSSELQSMAQLFKVLGEISRLRILDALLRYEELCVNHLAEYLEMEQSAVSHQLRILREAHLIKNRKEGKNVVYSLDDNHVRLLLEQCREHINHQAR